MPAAIITCFATASAFAADVAWIGLNSTAESLATDINDGANWDSGTVPTTGDTAIFNYSGLDQTNTFKGDLFISAADTNFNPSGLTFNSNVDPNSWAQEMDLYLDKSLTLTDGFSFSGYGSGGGSGQQNDRFRVGTQASGVTLDITSWTTTGQAPGWAWFNLGAGTGVAGTAFNFTGSSFTFATPDNSLSQSINGGKATEDAALIENPSWNFTNVGGTINLESPNNRTSGTIGLGLVHLNVRSDQTWTAEETAFVSMTGSTGSSGNSGKFIVGSIDGGRLDNLGELDIKLYSTSQSSSLATAMQLHGGTYGSLQSQGDTNTVARVQAIKMNDDVSLIGSAVLFNELGEAYDSDYGFALRQVASIGTQQTDSQNFYTQGFTLDISKGILLEDLSSSSQAGRNLKLFMENSNVSIGGDVLMTGDAYRLPGGGDVNTNIGLDGGANGANVTLGGSWIVHTVAAKGSSNNYNLSTSTLTMTGGDGAESKTWEVGDASSTTGVQAQTWSVATFNIGVDAGDTSHIKLVNEFLNDNPFVSDPNIDKIGEKLIAGALNVRENSYLDANLGEANVEVASLLLETGATLDLNTGLTLTDGQNIAGFVGLGDLTSSWNTFSGQVIDSSNPLFAFSAVYLGGSDETVWQAALVPEPGTWALLAGLAGLGYCIIRRRK